MNRSEKVKKLRGKIMVRFGVERKRLVILMRRVESGRGGDSIGLKEDRFI